MVALGGAHTPLEKTIGFHWRLLAAGNACRRYVVTERMLEMFQVERYARQGAAEGGALMPSDATVLNRETLIRRATW